MVTLAEPTTYDYEYKSFQPDPSRISILDLNDDCLIMIFSYLSNHQLVNSLGTSRKLDEIIDINLRHCKKLRFKFRYFNNEDRRLLWRVGPYLTSVEFIVGYSIRPEVVLSALKLTSRCEQLKSITLQYVEMCEQYLQYIANISDSLQNIDLSFCQLTDDLLIWFVKNCNLHQLKKLTVIGNYALLGSSLVHLRNLKNLTLESHAKFSINLDEIKMNNPDAEIVIYDEGRFKKRIF